MESGDRWTRLHFSGAVVRPLQGRSVGEAFPVGCRPRLFTFIPFGDVCLCTAP